MASWNRRDFLSFCGAGAATFSAASASFGDIISRRQNNQPNIMWITTEDINPYLGCYGDPAADTPFLDSLAEEGAIFTNVYSTSGVCAPSRNAVFTGMYPTTLGLDYMRGSAYVPDFVKHYPYHLHEAGYHVTNAGKEDWQYNPPGPLWNKEGAYSWRDRGSGQPFFHVHNYMTTHESRVLQWGDKQARTDIPLPPYYPDTEKVRKSMAAIYAKVTEVDQQIKEYCDQLKADGLWEDTIVWIFGDNGGPSGCRGKRWVYDSGLRVPLIIRIPDKFLPIPGFPGPGQSSDELISFIDFAPTVINLAGGTIPDYMQGQAFLGDNLGQSREYIHASRSRMDERYDMRRAVRDKRYKYIRNYEWWVPYHDKIPFMEENNPILQEMRRLDEAGELTGIPAQFMAENKPLEELYDCENDPYETVNLAANDDYQSVLERMRNELERWQIDTRDIGFMPEAEQYSRERGSAENRWNITHPSGGGNPVESWLDAQQLSNSGTAGMSEMVTNLDSGDMVRRTWACIGLGNIGPDAASAAPKLKELLNDPCPDVQIEAARGLVLIGSDVDDAFTTLFGYLEGDTEYIRLHAVNRIDQLGNLLKSYESQLSDVKSTTSHWKIEALLGYTLESIDDPPQREPQSTWPVSATNRKAGPGAVMSSPYAIHVAGQKITCKGPAGRRYNFHLFDARGSCVVSRIDLTGDAVIQTRKKPAPGFYTAKFSAGNAYDMVRVFVGQ
ncbi:MAG: sulfatase-like hydrolase/transferase [Chitinivibrionales bacterium]|nr:sulfatase-like hydrolase/transferase [Chitinivibrionales bacterium]